MPLYSWGGQKTAPVTEAASSRRSTLQSWYAKLARSSSSRINVVCIGASGTEGYPVNTWDQTFPAALRSTLRRRLGISGGGRGFIGISSAGQAYMWPMVMTGGTRNITAGYGPKFAYWASNVAGNKQVTTLSGAVTSFDVVHMKGPSGGATAGYYKVDGGAAVTFSTSNATNVWEKLHFAVAANTSIEVGCNGGGFIALGGIIEYAGDENSGLQVHNCGLTSTTLNQWLNNHATPAGWLQGVALLSPDVIVCDLGANDRLVSVGNRTSAQYKADLIAFIALLRSNGITCPVVMSMVYDVESGSYTYVEPWANYVAAAKAVASADTTVTVVDHSAYMPATNATNTYSLYHTDSVHSEAGGAAYRLMAGGLANVLLAETLP